MPILDIEVVGPLPARVRRGLAARVATACGAALRAAPGHSWARVRHLSRSDYGESGGDVPPGVRPVFVGVLLADLPSVAARARLATSLAAAVAGACRRPVANVHVCFHPPGRGRVAFGGRLLR